MMCEMTENVCDSFLGFAWLLSRNFVFVWDFSPPCIKAYTGAYDRTKSGNLQQISVCDCAQELSLHSSAKAEKKMTISRYSRRKGAPRWLLELLRDFSSPQYSNEHTFWITFWIKTRFPSVAYGLCSCPKCMVLELQDPYLPLDLCSTRAICHMLAVVCMQVKRDERL